MDWSRVPLLLVTALLLVGAVTEIGTPAATEAMTAVGFVMLGAWASIEIQSWYQNLRRAWEMNENVVFEQAPREEVPDETGQLG
jgi:hypothetical protein